LSSFEFQTKLGRSTLESEIEWKILGNKKSPLFQWTALGRPKTTGLGRFRPKQGSTSLAAGRRR
jgi:hypothetical protein